MRIRSGRLLWLLAGILLLAAPQARHWSAAASAAQQAESLYLTLDQQFAQIAERVPGFAGLHIAGDAVVISLKEPARLLEARREVEQILGPEVLKNRRLTFQAASWDFLQLAEWYRQLQDQVWQVGSVNWTDIDERYNVIRIGVGTLEGRARLEQVIQRSGVPREAVVIDLPEGALSERNPLAGCQTGERPPEGAPSHGYRLALSPAELKPGIEITLRVEGAREQDQLTSGVAAYLDCWDGARWTPRFSLFRDRAATLYNPGAVVVDVGYDASRPARFTLPEEIAPGWYRLRYHIAGTVDGRYAPYDLTTLIQIGR
ncbi:MAG: hypothetical protein ACOY93_00210 [Bacillota bacterium]